MINTYLNDLDAFISANDAVTNVDVIRRDIRETGLGKIALYRYCLKLKDRLLSLQKGSLRKGENLIQLWALSFFLSALCPMPLSSEE